MVKKSSKRKNSEVEKLREEEDKELLKNKKKDKTVNDRKRVPKKKSDLVIKEKLRKEVTSKKIKQNKKSKANKESHSNRKNKISKSRKDEDEKESEEENGDDNESKDSEEESDDDDNESKDSDEQNDDDNESKESDEDNEDESEQDDEELEEESDEEEIEEKETRKKNKKKNNHDNFDGSKKNKKMKIGIFYVSSNGKTKQIVNYIKKGIMKKYDLKVDSILIGENVKYDLSKYQLIIVGGPVYYGGYSENLTSFIESNVEYLNNAYTAFFSVSCYSVSISSPFDYDPLIKNYLKSTLSDEFKPRITASFGGDLSYTKYSPSLKWVAKKSASQMKQCVKNEDITDTSKNHSLTKWKWVDDFINKYISEGLPKKYLKVKSKI